MSGAFDLAQPWALLLLPLAALPLLRRRRDTLAFPSLAWVPHDPVGRAAGVVWRVLAVLALLAVILALAGPGRPETLVPRTGHGAEIQLLIDRSRSMDEHMLPRNWKEIDPIILRAQSQSIGEPKGKAARELLSAFVAQRPDDRFSLMFFSSAPIPVTPFTEHDEVVQAGITAGGIGRGLSNTDVGRALLAAIGQFDGRPYSGSRIILLVSDGASRLDDETRAAIRAGLLKHRISLYWLYLRTFNGSDLEHADELSDALEEVALHRFFGHLPTPYHLYQASTPEDLAAAVADVGRQQNFPLDFLERVPRRDYSRHFLAAAALCCALLIGYRAMQLRRWA